MTSDELPVVKAFVEFLYKGFYSFGDRISINRFYPNEGFASEHDHTRRSMHLPTRGVRSQATSAHLPLGSENAEDGSEQVRKIHRAKDLPFHVKMYIAGDLYNVLALKDFASNRFRDATKEIEDLLPEHATDFAKSIRLCWNGTHDTDMRLRDVITEFVFENLGLAMSCHALRNIWPQEGSFIDGLLKSGSELYKKSEFGAELDDDWFRDHDLGSCGGGCGGYLCRGYEY